MRAFLLDFAWNCGRLLEAKNFSRNPGQFKWVTRKSRYHVSLTELVKRNLMIQDAKLFWRPTTMLKISYFSWDQHFFQKLPGTKFLCDRGLELFHYLPGRHNLRMESHFQQYCQPRKLLARISPRHLDRVFFKTSQIHLKKDAYHVTSLTRLKHILDKKSILWHILWYVSKIYLESIRDCSKISTRMILCDIQRIIEISDKINMGSLKTVKKWKFSWE